MSDALFNQASELAIKMTGKQVIYINQAGVKSTIWATIDKDVVVCPSEFETGVMQKRTEISFIYSDVQHIKHGEKIVDGNTLFTVADVLEDDGFIVKVSVK